jgi:hypothetical protein
MDLARRPNPATLVLARMVIFFQLGLPAVALLIGGNALAEGADGVRSGVVASVALLAIILTLVLGVFTGQGRPLAWVGAVLLQLAFAAAYCWLIYWTYTAPSPEGMLAAFGLLIGAPLVLMSLTGLVLLLVPPTRRYCLTPP